MKKFVLLHYGFEKPTPEIMAAWSEWFEAMKGNIVEMAGPFVRGRKISKGRDHRTAFRARFDYRLHGCAR